MIKQKDLLLISVIIIISGVSSFFISNLFFGKSKHSAKIEIVDKITPEFTIPGNTYFNNNSINPTRLINIKENQNASPFE